MSTIINPLSEDGYQTLFKLPAENALYGMANEMRVSQEIADESPSFVKLDGHLKIGTSSSSVMNWNSASKITIKELLVGESLSEESFLI
ncbi:hypothetical protein CDAR_416161 [Caerostris darwini]|uniref:Vitellogenin n=1 Tax=Caerostris darwini TaxID=1538125 RepID=A0AAV4W7S0_9ARAC|nr:hypothetical protein CDAR_416161 [Caerostris darwini]